MGRTLFVCTTLLLLCQPCRFPAAEEVCAPGELRTDSTPNSISVEWNLAGDSDHNAACNVQYRQQGSGIGHEALPLFRVDYQWWYHTERAGKPLNLFAGSKAVDAGAVVPNISDDFVGRAPDLGAHECGREMPHYGPRRQ